MIIFEPITEELIEDALDIVNSNSHYNILENGNPLRSKEEVRSEFLNQTTDSFFIKVEDKQIGIIDFLENNPKDNYPWIGLFMIHADYHSLGYGKMSYVSFEDKLKLQNFNNVRIGVLQNNNNAKEFWISLGFEFYAHKEWEGKIVDCYEKQLTHGS